MPIKSGSRFQPFCVVRRTETSPADGLTRRVIGDGEGWAIRDGEVVAGYAIGWNFGEGHLHNWQLLAAIQER